MSGRGQTTAMLSRLTERRCVSAHRFHAPEVTLEDPKTGRPVRVDYMGFDPYMCGSPYPNPSSVTLGRFTAYEIKSCWADLTSGHGLNLVADDNWLVTTGEVEDRLAVEVTTLLSRLTGVLVPCGERLRVSRKCKVPRPFEPLHVCQRRAADGRHDKPGAPCADTRRNHGGDGMSDEIVEMHGVTCDWPGCGRVAQDEDADVGVWPDYEDALDYVQEWLDWAHIDGRDYCPEHHHYDEETGEDVPGPETVCVYPACGRSKGDRDGGWLHDSTGDWCPYHWRHDGDGFPRPQAWFDNGRQRKD